MANQLIFRHFEAADIQLKNFKYDPLVSNVAMTKSMLLQFLHQIKNFKNHVNDLIATCSQSKYNREKKETKKSSN